MEGTLEYISIVRKHEAIYNIYNPDYKNYEAKSRAWLEVAEEVGLTIEACKRKWKNLRDSYTKYLRSFRTGTKTSRKYQYWSHAHHMDFLKPFQGPPRAQVKAFESQDNQMYKEESECDLGFDVLEKFIPPDCSTWTPESPKVEDFADDEQSPIVTLDEPVVKITIPDQPVLQIPTLNINPPLKTTIKVGNCNGSNPSIVRKRKSATSTTESSAKRAAKSIDISKIIQANHDVDAISLFFLSLAKSVATMPKKQQAIVKMKCMKIVSETEIQIENSDDLRQSSVEVDSTGWDDAKTIEMNGNENSEHFLYCMSPSRVEAMIDISSDDDWNGNSNGN